MGPDNGGGDPSNIANRIAANRDMSMKSVLIHDLKDNWFANPDIAGDLSMYFVLCSSFTRYGSWGATEEVGNMHTPKLQAIYEITGITEDVSGPDSPGNTQKSMVGNNAVITWEAATDNVAVTHYRISDNTGALATVLANEPLTVALKNYNPANLNNIKVIAVDAFNNVSGFKLGNENNGAEKERSLVFPNPSKSGTLTIYLAKSAIGSKLTLLDPQGKERVTRNDDGREIVHMNISLVSPGIYLLKIESDSWFEVIKVIRE
jgi:hypothetical protein